MQPPGPHLVMSGERYRRTIATAVVSVLLATGCSSPSIDDASRAEAAAIGPDATAIPTGSIPPITTPLPTLHDVLAQDRFVALSVALQRSGLDVVLGELDDFVLLAPTGAAFASSGTDIGIEYSTLMNDTRTLEAILRYHIVADPSTSRSWRTLNGAALDVDGDANAIERVDNVEILDQVAVRGGTVLVISRLLVPAPVASTPVQPED